MDAGMVTSMPFEAYRQQMENQARMEAKELKLDESVPGGVFLNAAGQKVDCNGKLLGNAKQDQQDEASQSEYSKMTVSELKEELSNREIEVLGNPKKADLVSMLEADDAEFNSYDDDSDEDDDDSDEE